MHSLIFVKMYKIDKYTHTHTHTHTRARARVCVCVCIYINIYINMMIDKHYEGNFVHNDDLMVWTFKSL